MRGMGGGERSPFFASPSPTPSLPCLKSLILRLELPVKEQELGTKIVAPGSTPI